MYPARDCFKREEARRKTESQREKGLERKREMSQLLWEKSGTWRWLVKQTRDSKPFFLAFATVCGVIPGVIGYCVMQFTSSHNEQLEAQLRKNARPESLMMGQVNRERLAEYLGELQRKENTNDRYVAALRGETLTRNPYVRIQPIPKDSSTELPKKSNTELPKKSSTEAVQEKEPKK